LSADEARKYFFFEKKKQKTFALIVDAAGTIDTYRSGQKFFGSFFQKRTAFLRLPFPAWRCECITLGAQVRHRRDWRGTLHAGWATP
jgi:hypothetical protein